MVAGCFEILAVLGCFGVGLFFRAIDIIDQANKNENYESDGKEIDNILEKIANGDVSG